MKEPLFTIILIVANGVFSIMGFQKPELKERYMFDLGKVLHKKEYERILTGAFLHSGWPHLLFNMITLYYFGGALEKTFGVGFMLVVYFTSLAGGKAMSWLLHPNGDYRSVGASGAILGLLFAYIVVDPMSTILLMFIIPVPAFLYALGYTIYTLVGVSRGVGRIGHEAHLGGAITGTLLTALWMPEYAIKNWWIILISVVPTAIFLYLKTSPERWLRFKLLFKGKKKTGEEGRGLKYERGDSPSKARQRSLDELLDKVARKGYNGLTKEEKLRLDELSSQSEGSGSTDDRPR